MNRNVDVRRVGLQAVAKHDAQLAVRIDALAHERRLGINRAIAGHALPNEMAFVVGFPHVAAGRG
jgi:hypothetical protein